MNRLPTRSDLHGEPRQEPRSMAAGNPVPVRIDEVGGEAAPPIPREVRNGVVPGDQVGCR
jgi:hypothetical protein